MIFPTDEPVIQSSCLGLLQVLSLFFFFLLFFSFFSFFEMLKKKGEWCCDRVLVL